MKRLAIGVAVATLMAAAWPAWSQTSTPQSNATHPGNVTGPAEKPGTGGVSKPGVPGEPGGKSGRTVTPSGSTSPEHSTKARRLQGEKDVRGEPGGKSGATVTPQGTENSGSSSGSQQSTSPQNNR